MYICTSTVFFCFVCGTGKPREAVGSAEGREGYEKRGTRENRKRIEDDQRSTTLGIDVSLWKRREEPEYWKEGFLIIIKFFFFSYASLQKGKKTKMKHARQFFFKSFDPFRSWCFLKTTTTKKHQR